MRITRIFLTILGVLLGLSLIAGSLAYISLNNRNAARPEARAALEPAADVNVTRIDGEDWIIFTPEDQTPTTGFVIYPGGFVDPIAYAAIAREIAQQGFLVIIDPMPLNLAVLGSNEAGDVMAAFPEISTWAIGGHSLGGAMAADYAYKNPGVIDGLALWAAYPSANSDLSGFDMEVVSIFGDADGVASVNDVQDGAVRLPASTEFILIPGGNHTQFGRYGEGLQRGDNPAEISRDEQQRMVVDSTIEMLMAIDNR